MQKLMSVKFGHLQKFMITKVLLSVKYYHCLSKPPKHLPLGKRYGENEKIVTLLRGRRFHRPNSQYANFHQHHLHGVDVFVVSVKVLLDA